MYEGEGNNDPYDAQEVTWSWGAGEIFGYDDLNRLTPAYTDAAGAGQYNHTYSYSPSHKHAVTGVDDYLVFGYDANGNMISRLEGSTGYTQNFNVENELSSVVVSSQTTSFTYDAAGIHVKTVEPTGKTPYYPFPGYGEEANSYSYRLFFNSFR